VGGIGLWIVQLDKFLPTTSHKDRTRKRSLNLPDKISAVGARVLIVDDAEDTREMYAMFLRLEGFQIAVAGDGLTGLTFAQQHRPDIIVLDLMMPRMDGFEVMRRLRADDRTKAIPIIAFSGMGATRDAANAIAAGADTFCAKPCPPETLLEMITRLLRLRGDSAA